MKKKKKKKTPFDLDGALGADDGGDIETPVTADGSIPSESNNAAGLDGAAANELDDNLDLESFGKKKKKKKKPFNLDELDTALTVATEGKTDGEKEGKEAGKIDDTDGAVFSIGDDGLDDDDMKIDFSMKKKKKKKKDLTELMEAEDALREEEKENGMYPGFLNLEISLIILLHYVANNSRLFKSELS